ncbi:hypothetical protein CX658_30725 [Pseudomonas amygdali pv. lachrymans]|nr:hypothetical protein CX658_30725 [Pseudomonas amygdali pv. lachrymans]
MASVYEWTLVYQLISKKSNSISISTLARFAAQPSSVFAKVDAGAVKYGNRAHAAIGRGPSLIKYVLLAALVVAAAKYLGVF